MSIVRVPQLASVLVLIWALAGCGLSRLDTVPSKEVDLSGSWVLDRAASDDPKPILAKLRPTRRAPPPEDSMDDDTGPPAGAQQGGGQRGGRSRRGEQSQPMMVYRNGNDAFTHGAVIKALMADLARAESLTIEQSPERFSLDYGSSVRTFTPGSVSVVSASWGVADQSSGWKGKQFVIHIKPQAGVASLEKYSLADDGKHLIEELELGGGDFPSVQLKRVYDRTDKPLPRAVPNID
jgi:hypothetical protein